MPPCNEHRALLDQLCTGKLDELLSREHSVECWGERLRVPSRYVHKKFATSSKGAITNEMENSSILHSQRSNTMHEKAFENKNIEWRY